MRRNPAYMARIVICSLVMLSLGGCWDRVEVNDLALVTAAAIDKSGGDEIRLSVQVFIPRTGGGGGQSMSGGKPEGGGGGQSIVRTGTGVTIADAMSKVQEVLPRRLFWGHTEVFIIGEKLAATGIRKQVDFILRFPLMRERSNLFISNGEAKQVVESIPPLERFSAEVLKEMVKSKIGLNITVNELAQMLSGDSNAAVLPWVEMLHAKGNERHQPIPYIKGSAVFKDDRMVGMLDQQSTRGVLWLRNEMDRAVVTVAPDGEDGGHVSFLLLKSSTQLIPNITGDAWSMTVKIETEDDIIQNTTRLDINKPEITRQLGKLLEKDIEDRVHLALRKAQQELKADIFGFNQVFHSRYSKQWNQLKHQWEDKFPTIEVNVEAKAKVLRPGMITTGGSLPKEEVKK